MSIALFLMPVWRQLTDNSYFTGHIDLLAVIDSTLVIADYKPTKTEIIKSIPQICAYAYMAKQRLEIKDFSNIICVGFSKNITWSLPPQILGEKILTFIEELNAQRVDSLKSKRNKRKNITELQNDIWVLVT